MATRIERKFEELRRRDKKAFIAYITAGDPSLRATPDIVSRLEDAGVDVVELGIPFSDPLADGRVNQQAATRALAQGATPEGVFRCVRAIRRHSEVPILFYSYLNLLCAGDFGANVKAAAAAGADGLLVLDLPVEESKPYLKWLKRCRLNNITLVTPTSPAERIKRIVATASGFVYCVSREGVTGMQDRLGGSAGDLIRRTRRYTRLPVALGFGISSPAQARAAAALADAVIVGSSIVDAFASMPAGRAAAWVGKLVKAVKEI